MNEIIKSKKFKTAAIIVGVILGALIIFAMGISVGIHKGKFSCNWGKNYEKNFMGKKGGMEKNGFMTGKSKDLKDRFENRGFRNAHGLAGEIISITEDNKIIIKDQDEKENTISVDEKTLIKSRQDDLKITDLKQGDRIVIMGNPDESGVIKANLIRVFGVNPIN